MARPSTLGPPRARRATSVLCSFALFNCGTVCGPSLSCYWNQVAPDLSRKVSKRFKDIAHSRLAPVAEKVCPADVLLNLPSIDSLVADTRRERHSRLQQQREHPHRVTFGLPVRTKPLARWRKLGVFSRFSPANLWDTVATAWRLRGDCVVSAELQSEKHFRTINVQWIGQWGLFRPSSTSWNQ